MIGCETRSKQVEQDIDHHNPECGMARSPLPISLIQVYEVPFESKLHIQVFVGAAGAWRKSGGMSWLSLTAVSDSSSHGSAPNHSTQPRLSTPSVRTVNALEFTCPPRLTATTRTTWTVFCDYTGDIEQRTPLSLRLLAARVALNVARSQNSLYVCCTGVRLLYFAKQQNWRRWLRDEGI